jgi:CheY-like chemotaxis protein
MPTIVIADDLAPVRQLLRMTLSSQHTVLEAKDGGEALELLRRHHTDVAVLDVVMPVLDGLHLCRLLREDPAFRALKIVIVSANATEHDALQAGADRFVAKPFSPIALLRVIDDLTDSTRITGGEAASA